MSAPITEFSLKDVVANEEQIQITDDMSTLGDLRWYVTYEHPIFRFPANVPHLVRFVCNGTSYNHKAPDSTPLTTILQGTSQGPNEQRYIWLIWMGENDYMCVFRGGMFMEEQYEQK